MKLNNAFKNKLKTLLAALSVLTLMVFFQNCSWDSFQSKLPTSDQMTGVQNNQLDLPSEDFNDDDLADTDDILNIPQSDNPSNLTAAATTSGKVYYVATNGNDSYTGTISMPFKTIQKAIKIVKAGDTVLIRKGRHAPFDLSNVNGASGKPIIFRGEAGAIIDRNLAGSKRNRNIEFWGGSYVTIDKLELTDSDPMPGGILNCTTISNPYAGRQAIKLNKGSTGTYPHHLIFSNLHVHGTASHAILGTANDSQLLNGHLHDLGDKMKKRGAYGTYLKGKGWIIRGNRIYNANGNGIRTGNDPSTSTSELLVDSIIENNFIYNNGGDFTHPSGPTGCRILRGGDGLVVWHGSGNIIRNNVVYNNVGYGIRVNENLAVSSKPSLVYNNTVYKNGAQGIFCYAGEKTIVKNNIAYLSGRENIINDCAQRSNNLTIDPKFVSLSSLNFRLQAVSTAIDKGVTLKEVPKDFSGIARPRGRAYDIGAFEY